MDARTPTLRCTSCGALCEARCSCGASYKYISPGELAAMAVKTNPGKSDRAIADEIGVGNKTVSRARQSTVSNDTVETSARVGRDSKVRVAPQPKQRKNNTPEKATAASAVLDAANTFQQAAETAGLKSVQSVKTGVAYEEGRRAALKEVAALSDHLPMSAKQKFEASLRAFKKILEHDNEQKIIAEVNRRFDKAFPTLQAEKNAAFRTEQMYYEYLKKAPKAMTVPEFTLVLSLLHPDSRVSATDERLLRAFQMFKPKKFAITGER
jgi:hypothetical protein